jgi:alpha-L-fucosidase
LTELLTNFGQIDLLWMDFSYADRPEGKGYQDWDAEGLIEIARRLQPKILINNRMGMYHADWGWDFDTPEQFMPSRWPEKNGVRVPWEPCQTFSGSWGYHRDEQSWKNVRQLIVMLIETVSKGGNLLLNVGPTARGVFDYRAVASLEGIGEWMRFHDRSIYGATQAPDGFQTPQNSFLTYNPALNRLYVHVIEWPFHSLILPGMAGKVKYAQLLNDASEIRFHTQAGEVHGHMTERLPEEDLVLRLPVRQPNVAVPVIELFLK